MADTLDSSAAFGTLFQISQRLNQVYSTVEGTKGVLIPSTVRNFTEALITEALIFNRFDETDPKRIIDTSVGAVSSILDSVAPTPQDGTNYITLIGVLEQVHVKWCRIFPFCR